MEIVDMSENEGRTRVDPWVQALDRLYTDFRDYSEKAIDSFGAEDIHQARVNSRKLLTLLRILDRKDRSDVFLLLKEAQKRLGKVRDTDVLIEAFKASRRKARKSDANVEAGLLKAVIRYQKKTRQQYRKKLARKLPKLLSPSLDEKWATYMSTQLDAQATGTDMNQVMRELEVSYEQTKRTYRQVSRQSGPESSEAFEALHNLRIAAKELRYTASAAAFALDQKFHSHERMYKDIQEQLGLINDKRMWLEAIEAIGRDQLGVSKKTWRAFNNRLKAEISEALQASPFAMK